MAKLKPFEKPINLLEPVAPPNDTWTDIYDWIFGFGKYLLVFVQVLVLAIFFTRFTIDKQKNDLTDDINDKIETLNSSAFKEGEVKYANLIALSTDIKTLSETQVKYSDIIDGVINSIPSNVTLKTFSYNGGIFTLSLETDSLENNDYEKRLKENPIYDSVTVSVNKAGESSKIIMQVSFRLKSIVK